MLNKSKLFTKLLPNYFPNYYQTIYKTITELFTKLLLNYYWKKTEISIKAISRKTTNQTDRRSQGVTAWG